jgi:hypothetical protein
MAPNKPRYVRVAVGGTALILWPMLPYCTLVEVADFSRADKSRSACFTL